MKRKGRNACFSNRACVPFVSVQALITMQRVQALEKDKQILIGIMLIAMGIALLAL